MQSQNEQTAREIEDSGKRKKLYVTVAILLQSFSYSKNDIQRSVLQQIFIEHIQLT